MLTIQEQRKLILRRARMIREEFTNGQTLEDRDWIDYVDTMNDLYPDGWTDDTTKDGTNRA